MQINLNLLELADYETAQDITEEIFNQNPNVKFPINLEHIASQVGISDIQYLPLEGIERALIANDVKSEGIIAISENIIPTKRRFTLAHELGHFLIPRHGHRMQCTVKDMAKRDAHNEYVDMEAEANLFASLLLMPPKLINERQLISASSNIQNIVDLKSTFDVSLQACANNYINLHQDHLAVVYTYNRTILYGLNCDSNPFWLVANKSSSVPADSQLAKINLNSSEKFHSNEVRLSTWFSVKQESCIGKTILEETFVQENGYATTLLKVMDLKNT